MIGSDATAFQRKALAKARKADADALWHLRPDGLLEIHYVPAEERRRKKPGRDEYVEGLGRRHTIRVHPSTSGHPPYGRCGFQWEYCETCRASDLPLLNRDEMGKPPSGLRDRPESTATPTTSSSTAAAEPLPPPTDFNGHALRTRVEPARGEIEGYEVLRGDRTLAIQRERKLVDDFCTYLASVGRDYTAFRTLRGSGEIVCDVYDETRHILFEAKSEALLRPHIRMAIGQLLDYAYHLFAAEERATLKLSLLLPHPPNKDIEEMLHALGIGLTSRNGQGGFTEEERRCTIFAQE